MNEVLEIDIKNPDGTVTKYWMDWDKYQESLTPTNYMKKTIINEIPLNNRLIILEDKAPSVRASGIILEGDAAIKPYTGYVLAVGPECETVKQGDTVRYAVRAGDKVTINEQDYLMLKETDLYTIFNK